MLEATKGGNASTRTYPFLEAAFRAPLRADGDRDGLLVGRHLRLPPRFTKRRKPNANRELHNYY